MRVTVIGSGYVGLVTGACLSDLGFRVVCLDKDIEKVQLLQRGERNRKSLLVIARFLAKQSGKSDHSR